MTNLESLLSDLSELVNKIETSSVSSYYKKALIDLRKLIKIVRLANKCMKEVRTGIVKGGICGNYALNTVENVLNYALVQIEEIAVEK